MTASAERPLVIRSHGEALWWLGLLYRDPERFQLSLKETSKTRALSAALRLVLNALPYVVLISLTSRLLLHGAFGLEPTHETAIDLFFTGLARDISIGIAFGIAGGISFGISGGIAGGIAFGISFGIAGGIAVGISGGIAGGIAFGISFGISGGIAAGIARGIAVGISGGIAVGISGGIVGGIAGGIAFGIAFGIAGGIAGGIAATRSFYLPFSWYLGAVSRTRHQWFHHPVFWDKLIACPMYGLDRMLVHHLRHHNEQLMPEVDRLIETYPSQRRFALSAKTIWLAERAAEIEHLGALTTIIDQLPEGKKGFISQTPLIKEKVSGIVHQARVVASVNRPYLKRIHLELLIEKIEAFRGQVAGFREPLASGFTKAARHWLALVRKEKEQYDRAARREPVHQLFRAGDPVDREQEAFVPRLSVLGKLERQVMMAQGSPALVLYGRRRTGKSTLLTNLAGFLPEDILHARVSLQDPSAFSSQAHFFKRVHEICSTVAPRLSSEEQPLDLSSFFAMLSRWNTALGETHRLLLAIDEYENLDIKIGQGVFDADLLATLRESMQQHRRITWIFAGSHEITELDHADWTSYLVSARTIEVPFFSLEETHTLLSDPLRHAQMWGDRADRPSLPAGFWGTDGIDRVHAETAGWPHLVQLMAETLVDLANDRMVQQIDDDLYTAALAEAVVSGHTVLHQLLIGECETDAERQYLIGFRDHEAQSAPAPEVTRALKHRQLIVPDGDGYRLRVPLMRHWLQKRLVV